MSYYRMVSIVEREHGFVITINNQFLFTPGGKLFIVPNYALATAIAVEWQFQENRFLNTGLSLTQLVNTAIDRGRLLQKRGFSALLTFVATDLVCYRAPTPQRLIERQQIFWQPLLDWVATHYRASLEVTVGVMPIVQPEPAITALQLALEELDVLRLVAIYGVANVCGSLVIALALVEGIINVDTAFASAQLDLLFQMEQWGVDTAIVTRHESIHSELRVLKRFIELLA